MTMKKRISLMLLFAAIFFSACSEPDGFGYGDTGETKTLFGITQMRLCSNGTPLPL